MATKDIPEEFQAHCAVAGDLLDTRVAEANDMVAEYKGKKYYFCCPPCKPVFLAKPEQYADEAQQVIALTFTRKEHVSGNIWHFSFTPSQPVQWNAGQYIRVELPHGDPDESTKRWFTISSAPREEIITITTRVSDSHFKQALAGLSEGDTTLAMITPPSGDFLWEEVDDTERVFAIGGIGITPLYSIIKQRMHDEKPLNATVIYANRTEDVPLKDTFNEAAKHGLAVQYLTGETLTAERIMDAATTDTARFYISGAKPMVEALTEELEARGIAKERIIADAFSRYSMENY